MKITQVLQAWGSILAGRAPSLSIEITKECPLSCPGCYAYGDSHLGGEKTLTQLSDFRGDALVQGVLDLVRQHRPLQVSLVGGEPMMRKDLFPIARRARELGLRVNMITNGSYIRDIEIARTIAEIFNQVSVSVDGGVAA